MLLLVRAAGLLVAALTSAGEVGSPPFEPAPGQVPTAEGVAPVRGYVSGDG